MVALKRHVNVREPDAHDALQQRMFKLRGRRQEDCRGQACNLLRIERRLVAERLGAGLHSLRQVLPGLEQFLAKWIDQRVEPLSWRRLASGS